MDKKIIENFDKKQKALKHKQKLKQQDAGVKSSKKLKIDDVTFDEPSNSYRDRALERREGVNRDFEHDPDDMRITLGSTTWDDEDEFLDEDGRRLKEIEDSKYLGGDVEHTHLVKGLDFALLQKIKSEQKEKLADEEKPVKGTLFGDYDSDSEEEEFRMEAILAATDSSHVDGRKIDLRKLKKIQATETIPCRTSLARRILNVTEERYTSKSDLFLPGRMTYSICLDEDSDDPPVTTIVRSKTQITDIMESDEDQDKHITMDYIIKKLERIIKKT